MTSNNPNHPFFHIVVTGEDRNFKFGTMTIWMANHFQRGRGMAHVTHFARKTLDLKKTVVSKGRRRTSFVDRTCDG